MLISCSLKDVGIPKFDRATGFRSLVSRAEREVSMGSITTVVPSGIYVKKRKFRSFLIEIFRGSRSWGGMMTNSGSRQMPQKGTKED
jgi:hypothetical protein